MGERSNQIEQEIQISRKNLGENIGELQDRVKSAVDWRVQVEERPGTMLALAFGGGILISALFSSGRVNSIVDSSKQAGSDASRKSRRANSVPDHRDGVSKPLDAIKGALAAIAFGKLKDFIGEVVPGFQDEFTKTVDQAGNYPSYADSAAKFKTAGAD